jgi:dTDP-4-amino-4,6-dideoxygalactose transaminase
MNNAEVLREGIYEIKNDKSSAQMGFSNNHVFHLFVIRTENRQELQKYLHENGIQTVIHYPVPPQAKAPLIIMQCLFHSKKYMKWY